MTMMTMNIGAMGELRTEHAGLPPPAAGCVAGWVVVGAGDARWAVARRRSSRSVIEVQGSIAECRC